MGISIPPELMESMEIGWHSKVILEAKDDDHFVVEVVRDAEN